MKTRAKQALPVDGMNGHGTAASDPADPPRGPWDAGASLSQRHLKPERMPFALSASVASLGLVVVITQIGLQTKTMNPDIAQALIGAALLSSLLLPTLAGSLRSYAAIGAPMTRRQE